MRMSETEMVIGYMRKLSDFSISRSSRAMIPLGSCTMKINATPRMIPPDLGLNSATGHRSRRARRPRAITRLFKRLWEQWLCDITGYDSISLQPKFRRVRENMPGYWRWGYHAARGSRIASCA